MSVLIAIPARYASTRYPGKPLVALRGPDGQKTLIQRSWEAAMGVAGVDRVVVATDDDRIRDHATGFGAEVVMTSSACQNGTERCAEVAAQLPGYEIVVNLQGDAPLTPAWFVEDLVAGLRADPGADIATPVLRCDGRALNGFLADRRAGRVGGTTAVFGAGGPADSDDGIDTAFFSVATNPKTLEFVSGGWLAYCFVRGVRPPLWVFSLLAVSLAILFAGYMASEQWRTFGQGFFIVRYLMALIILFIALFFLPVAKHKFGKTSLLLGDASYSIYLFHSLALAVASGLWKRDILLPPDWISPWLLWCGLVVALSVYGVIIHLLIERPLLAWCRKRFMDRPPRKTQIPPSTVLPEQEQPASLRT